MRQGRFGKAARLLGAVVVLALVGAACSSADDDAAPSEDEAGAVDQTGVTAEEIHVGLFGAWDSGRPLDTDIKKTMEAVFNQVNDQGGVHGRKVVGHFESHKNTVEGAIDAAKRVENEIVLACECSGADTTIAAGQYLDGKGVPHFVNTWPESRLAELRHGYVFLTTIEDVSRRAFEYMANELGMKGKKVAMLLENQVAYQSSEKLFNEYGAQLGMQPVLVRKIETTQPSFVSELTAMKNAGAEGVICQCTAPVLAVARDAAAISYKPVVSGSLFAFDALSQAGKGALKDIRAVRLFATADMPGYQEWIDSYKKAYNAMPTATDGVVAYGIAKMIVHALEQAGEDPSRQSVEKAIAGFRNYDPKSIAPLTFAGGSHIGTKALLPARCCNEANQWVSEGPFSQSFTGKED